MAGFNHSEKAKLYNQRWLDSLDLIYTTKSNWFSNSFFAGLFPDDIEFMGENSELENWKKFALVLYEKLNKTNN